ncbi:hypothetical protein CBM2637_B100273 [Cupriavidus taiwanensis]|nr:hypothetical protein CBM2637_B100273 [Cupriavidus taiwanensis]
MLTALRIKQAFLCVRRAAVFGRQERTVLGEGTALGAGHACGRSAQ